MRATTPETIAIRAYVEDQVLEDVVHLEKVASELVGPARYDIRDVRSQNPLGHPGRHHPHRYRLLACNGRDRFLPRNSGHSHWPHSYP